MEKSAVAVFVKAPLPGHVKTRLARSIGTRDACELYTAMVDDITRAAGSCGAHFYLFHDSPDEFPLPQSWGSGAKGFVRQAGRTLGDRMYAAFELLFSAGYRDAVIVGSDIPGIDSTAFRVAFEALASHDAAIVPAFDGGYCLIGLNKSALSRNLFHGIEWSMERVLELTTLRMAECGLRLHLLEPGQDLDTLDDLRAYCRNPAPGAAATNSWVIRWQRREGRAGMCDEAPVPYL